jgi:hypothetical protein
MGTEPWGHNEFIVSPTLVSPSVSPAVIFLPLEGEG